jgi:hypothetical protein
MPAPAASQGKTPMTTHASIDVIDVTQDVAGLFALLDEVARGVAREVALAPEERAAHAEQILAWFAPRYAAIKAAAAAAPCPVPWTVDVADPAADSPDPDPHPCADCFTQRYRAWKRSQPCFGGPASG